MTRAPARALALLAAFLLADCASSEERTLREAWRREWNGRLEHMQSDWEHPCATHPFIAWADAFLARCETEPREGECAARIAWVDERVAQCRAWTAWQLRNFNQHERKDGAPPSMRIE